MAQDAGFWQPNLSSNGWLAIVVFSGAQASVSLEKFSGDRAYMIQAGAGKTVIA